MVSLNCSNTPVTHKMARHQVFLDRSTMSLAMISGATTTLSTAVQDTVAMTSGDRIRPARVPGIQSTVQNAP